jgi:hypothetical protein
LTGQLPTTPPPSGSATAVGPGFASARPSPADPLPSAQEGSRSALRRRRDELAEQVLELHWDLGGLAYEMAIRDHFRLDVLVRRAALLQERDAELAEVERLLHLEEGASAGVCPACGAPHSRGALFCWQCGGTLMERAPSSALAESAGAGSDRAHGDEARSPGAHSEEAESPGARSDGVEDVAAQNTLVMDPAPAFGE